MQYSLINNRNQNNYVLAKGSLDEDARSRTRDTLGRKNIL